MNDPKTILTDVLKAVIPHLPVKLRIPAWAILGLLKTLDLGASVAAAPATVHDFIGGLFDQLTLALKSSGYDVLANVAGLVERYILTGLTDAVWDTIATKIGLPVFTTTTAARSAGVQPVLDVDAELEACCAA